MLEVKCGCPKCGAEIKYIPTRDSQIVVNAEYVEVINDRGRTVQGHFRHKCAEKKGKAHE
jgi:hypothetical protein